MVTGDRARIAAAVKALMHSALRERVRTGRDAWSDAPPDRATPRWAVVAIGDEAALPDAGAAPRCAHRRSSMNGAAASASRCRSRAA